MALAQAAENTVYLEKGRAHVVLVNGVVPAGTGVCLTGSFDDRAFFRAFPDGTVSQAPFRVPRGKFLVITDVEWSVNADFGPPVPGRTLVLDIVLGTGLFPAITTVFQSRVVTLDADTAAGRPGASDHLSTGFVVGPGVPICPLAAQRDASLERSLPLDRIILRGYLVSALSEGTR
jgi:hypothetical protein